MFEPFTTPARQAAALNDTVNRPWPLPRRPWVLAQTLEDQLLAHWRVPVEAVAELVPDGVEPDTHDGDAWITLTTFRAAGVRLRGTLPVPLLSSFLQANVRTYVRFEERPGVAFLSLDVSSPLAAEAGRRVYRAPVARARMRLDRSGPWTDVALTRVDGDVPAVLAARYRATGAVEYAARGSLDEFLAERFCLYARPGDGPLRRADVHHPPWPLQAGEVRVDVNTMLPPVVERPEEPDVCHVSVRQDVLLWPLVPAYEDASASASASRR